MFFLIVAIAYLFFQIKDNVRSLNDFHLFFRKSTLMAILIVFLLQFVNWTVETLKFKCLIGLFQKNNFLTLLKAVYVGNFTALLTPERLGNFLGRAFILREEQKRVTLVTIYGNSVQFLVTIIMFLFSMLFLYLNEINILIVYGDNLLFFISIAFVSLCVVSLVLFQLKWGNIFNKVKILQKWLLPFKEIDVISFGLKIKVIFLGLLRFVIFTIQYFILIKAFNINMDFITTIIFLGFLFGSVTLIPSLIPGNLGTREAICAILVGGGVIGLKLSLISFLVWLVNVGISAVFGGFLLLRNNSKR